MFGCSVYYNWESRIPRLEYNTDYIYIFAFGALYCTGKWCYFIMNDERQSDSDTTPLCFDRHTNTLYYVALCLPRTVCICNFMYYTCTCVFVRCNVLPSDTRGRQCCTYMYHTSATYVPLGTDVADFISHTSVPLRHSTHFGSFNVLGSL